MKRQMSPLLALSALALLAAGCASPDDEAAPAATGEPPTSESAPSEPAPTSNEPAHVQQVAAERDDVVVEASGKVVTDGRNVDVVGADLRRTAKALTVTVRYADLEEHASSDWMVDFLLVGSDRSRREVNWNEYDDGGGTWKQSVTMHRLAEDSVMGNACPGLEGQADYDADTVTVTVPTSCFGDPAWVKVARLKATARGGDGDLQWYVDTPLGSGPAAGRSEPLPRVT